MAVVAASLQDTINFKVHGSAGQTFAWIFSQRVNFELEGKQMIISEKDFPAEKH